MRAAFLISALIASALVTSRASAELYEIPIPVTGEYFVRQGRDFEIDLGFPLAEVREVRFRVEGIIVAPLERSAGVWPGRPVDGTFIAYLSDGEVTPLRLNGPAAGEATYPAPEPFAGVAVSQPDTDWGLLLDGRIGGRVVMRDEGTWTHDDHVYGGTGVISYASIIIDATPVPEPASLSLLLTLAVLLPRRRAIR